MDPQVFPAVPEDITQLTDEALDELIVGHEQGIVRVATGEAFAAMETPPSRNERRDMLATARDNLLKLRAEKAERTTEEQDFEAEVAEIVAEAGVELNADASDAEGDDAGDGDAADGEAAADADGEADGEAAGDGDEDTEGEDGDDSVTASATPRGRREYTRPPATPKRHQPLQVGSEGPVLVASAGLEKVREGTPMDRDDLAKATIERLRRMSVHGQGVREKVVIASASWADQYPAERRLTGGPESLDLGDHERIRAVRGRQALTAAGGWCAPSIIRYDIGALGTQARPVRDALTNFLATRGGLQYIPDMSIATTDTTDGISRITAAQDEAGGTAAVKECVLIECPDFTDVRADIIATCLQAGNLMSIAFPELVAAWQDLLGVAAARNRDTGLLDAIAADPQTKTVQGGQVYGAIPSVVYAFARLAAGYRSRHRLDDDEVLRSLAPAWLADLLVVDMINRQFPQFEVSRAGVAALIERLTGVNVTWYLDSETGEGQIFGTQADNAVILDFPDQAIVYLYPEGGILYVDQGELNIGLIRDSILTETNDVRFFAEVFENAAVLATEVFKAELTVCPTGAAAPPAAALLSCA